MTKKLDRRRIFIFMMMFFLILIAPVYFFVEKEAENKDNHIYLLNSGLVDCENASVEYILWTEEYTQAQWLDKQMPIANLSWQKQEVKNYLGQCAYKYTAQELVYKENERDIGIRLGEIGEAINGRSIRCYMEERVASSLDLDQYIENSGMKIVARTMSDNMSSIDAYYPNFYDITQKKQSLRIQILSRNKTHTAPGRTLLAVPAVFGEF